MIQLKRDMDPGDPCRSARRLQRPGAVVAMNTGMIRASTEARLHPDSGAVP